MKRCFSSFLKVQMLHIYFILLPDNIYIHVVRCLNISIIFHNISHTLFICSFTLSFSLSLSLSSSITIQCSNDSHTLFPHHSSNCLLLLLLLICSDWCVLFCNCLRLRSNRYVDTCNLKKNENMFDNNIDDTGRVSTLLSFIRTVGLRCTNIVNIVFFVFNLIVCVCARSKYCRWF